MLRLIIKSEKHGQSWRDFNSQADIDLFLQEKGDHFGRLAYQEIIDEVKDDEGNVIQPQQIIDHAATVEYVIQDVSDEYFKKDQKKVNKIARKIDLENIKWSEVDTIADIKKILKVIVDEINNV